MRMDRLWAFVAAILPALAALLVAMPAVDLAYQLRAGAEILERGIPTADTWTFTVAGTPWLDQQWGAQVVLRLVFDGLGWTGLAVLRAGLLALTFWLLFGAIRRASGASIPAAWAAILVLGSFVVAAPALALRPQLFAIALFAATLSIVVGRADRTGRVWLIPVLAAAWANVHGSFPLAFVLVGFAIVDDLLRGRLPEALRMVVVAAATMLATLVNPFGVDAWRYVADLASNPTIASQVSEWRAPSVLEPTGALFFGSVAAVAAVAVGALWLGPRSRTRRGGRLAAVAPLMAIAGFAALGVMTGRGLAWWALVAPVALAAIVRVSLGGDDDRPTADVVGPSWVPEALRPVPLEERPRRANTVIAAVLVLALLALLPSFRPVGPAGVPENVLSHAPQALTAELRELLERGTIRNGARVWNPQLWGSWLELAVPQLRFAVDSRIELFPASTWADAEVIAAGTGDWQARLERWQVFALVVAPEQVGLRRSLEAAPAWAPAYRGPDGSIWLR